MAEFGAAVGGIRRWQRAGRCTGGHGTTLAHAERAINGFGITRPPDSLGLPRNWFTDRGNAFLPSGMPFLAASFPVPRVDDLDPRIPEVGNVTRGHRRPAHPADSRDLRVETLDRRA